MNFITLEPEDFREFANKSPYKSFYQTPEIAKLREESGWTPYYFGVEHSGKIKAATMLVAKPAFLGKSVYYAPGGPLIDFEDRELVNFFMKNLKSYAHSHNGYVLHIEPYYELVERGRDGEVVEGGFDHKTALKNLRDAGFIRLPESDEPKYSFAMELKDQTADQIFADMKRNTRNHIRKAEKMGVTVRELKREELSIFKQITESTSARRNFTDKPLSYYEQMYDLFHGRGEVQFLIAEAKSIPMSAAMFMTYGDEVIYLFSGSDEQYMKEYNAQYLIQWHMIKYAVEHGFKRYNFYGIQGLPDKNSKDYGIYDFKKGFTSDQTGRVIELIGAHELPTNKTFYYLHQLLSKLKH
ncbi:peptidoglycan bridge formation glycyltransferase FemA/FemB family protein [Candidatus Saccharibacteria bacterium]|nr:peptidoglycan bridge formation glycyltransferase FemA/FemB family protein [Candidatus Saccharibacteria bacterium]